MRKVANKLILLVIATTLLFALLPNSSLATQSTSKLIRSSGSISYPSYPSGQNLAPMPEKWMEDINGASSSYASVDYSVLSPKGKPTVKVGPDYVRGTREVDANYQPNWVRDSIKPGDHIVYKVWAKTDSNNGYNTIYTGARIGFDLLVFTTEGETYVVDSLPRDANYLGDTSGFLLPWGNNWKQIGWDFIVPSTYYTKSAYWSGNIPLGGSYQICAFAAWVDAREQTDGPYAWFGDAELYINP